MKLAHKKKKREKLMINITRYYTNCNYDVKLYYDNKWILERKDFKETYQLVFKSLDQAFNFLKQKKYEVYRVVYG